MPLSLREFLKDDFDLDHKKTSASLGTSRGRLLHLDYSNLD